MSNDTTMTSATDSKKRIEEWTAKATVIAEQMDYLRHRWEDERDYEDFAVYRAAARKVVEANGFEFIAMTKAFALRFAVDTRYQCNMTIGLTQAKWKWTRRA